MKGVLLPGNGSAEVVECAAPSPGPHDVPIESTVTGRSDLADAADAFDRFEQRLTETVMFRWE